MIPAFLLTRQWRDNPTGVVLDLWFTTDEGPVQVCISHQKPIFFIKGDDAKATEQALNRFTGIEIKPLELKSFDGSCICGVYFESQQTLYRAREMLERNDIPCYESDIRPTERYLCERFITAAVAIDGVQKDGRFENPRLQPTEYRPQLRLMSLDIESDFLSDDLFSIAYVTNTESKTLMIGDGESTQSLVYFPDQKSLLENWVSCVQRLDPDVFIGWNVVNFDFKLLQKKATEFSVPFELGRDNSAPVWRKSQADNEHHFILIAGRIVLDGIDTLKSATYNFPSFALDSVAQELLDRGKLISDKGGNDESRYDPLYKAKEIQRQFHEDKASLAKYNLEDCQLVWDIFEKTDLIGFSIERARLTGLEMDRAGGSVAAFENLYLPRLHRKGFIAPNIGDYKGELSAPGGYVMDSEPGLHPSVLVLDYKSLYPSIIRTFRIDPYGRIVAKGEPAENVIEGYDGASFSKTEHILPELIAGLWQARDVAKKDKNAALSQAIKIIMNSFYGVLGTTGCRLHDSRLTSSITKRGHDIIIKTVELIEEAGYRVIYGDTDSVFVALGEPKSNQQAADIGNALVDLVNNYWNMTLQQQHGIDSALEMEFETHFNQFFMPTMRGSDLGSKKRYAGLVVDNQGNRKIQYKGLETVRTDWTQLARDFQQTLFEQVFKGENSDQTIRDMVQALFDGKT